MKQSTHRTSFALDRETVQRLRRLAAVWQVSQAEVVRRAVAMADEAGGRATDPASGLRALHGSGRGLVREAAERYLAEVAADRRAWRGEG